MTTLTKVLSVLVLGALVEGQQGQPRPGGGGQLGFARKSLEDGGVYTFQNVADRGLLTSIMTTQDVVTDDWRRQLPSQKWRASKAMVHTMYMFKPISEENSKIALSVSHSMRDMANFPIVRKEPYVIGYSSDLYWAVIASLDNFYMLRNDATGMCLESRGAGKPVGVSHCNYNVNQQWAIHAVPLGGNGNNGMGMGNGQF